MSRAATYLAFAGVDGSGKTTQARLLTDRLRAVGTDAVFVPSVSLAPVRTLLNELAVRQGLADHVELLGPDTSRLIAAIHKWSSLGPLRAALTEPGRVVITDRGVLCQYAVARAVGADNEELLRDIFADLPSPDLTIFIDLAGELAMRRLAQRGEREHSAAELDGLATAYRSLPEADTFTVIDGTGDPESVQAGIRTAVTPLLPSR